MSGSIGSSIQVNTRCSARANTAILQAISISERNKGSVAFVSKRPILGNIEFLPRPLSVCSLRMVCVRLMRWKRTYLLPEKCRVRRNYEDLRW